MPKSIFRVHPSIGIARVGDSREYYLGPETVAGMPLPDQPDVVGGLPIRAGTEDTPITSSDIRDADGRFKRQAARFRIYQYADTTAGNGESYPNSGGIEVTIGSIVDGRKVVDIVWTVHAANKKANWYILGDGGMEDYQGNHLPPLRNAWMGTEPSTTKRRRMLVIDPGPRAIRGRDKGPVAMDAGTTASYAGKDGKIVKHPDYPTSFPQDFFPQAFTPRGPIDTLGELHTDKQGRLIVAGGYGRAVAIRKKDGTTYPLYAAVNNDGWFDDTSDGPVSAVVCFQDGSTAQVHGGWVVCTDPGYAPQTLNVVSLWDEAYNTWVRDLNLRPEVYSNGKYKTSYRPYFDSEIKPVFVAAAMQRWNTNLPDMAIRAHDAVGRISPGDDPDKTIIAGLAYIRNPNKTQEAGIGVPLMPLALGDAGNSFLQPTLTQYFFLEQWSARKANNKATEMPLGSGEALDRAVLYNCLGGRFSPGIDMTFIIRDVELWERPWAVSGAGPFRIGGRHLNYAKAQPDLPFLGEGYIPLRQTKLPSVEPGDICKFMSVPWHTDYNSCATHNPDPNPNNNTTLFWSWPAQRPVNVYRAQDVHDGQLGGQYYSVRGAGTASPDPSKQGRYQDYLEMVENWPRIGVVIQGSQIDDGRQYSKEHFLEVQSLLDEQPVPPWPQNTMLSD